MAKLTKLYESFEAFINKDTKKATELYRQYFIESAKEINAKIELREFDSSSYNFGGSGDDDQDLADEVGVDGEDEAEQGEEESDETDMDLFDDESEDAGEVPSASQWAEFKDKFDELEQLFSELGDGATEDADDEYSIGDDEEDSLEFGDENDFGAEDDEDEFIHEGVDKDAEKEEDDEEELDESFDLKAVKVPEMKETGDVNSKSPVAGTAKSPSGVKATDMNFKASTATGSNTKLDTSAESKVKKDDYNNVQPNGKKVYTKSSQKGAGKETAPGNTQSITKDFR
jgi:hypothetical protein